MPLLIAALSIGLGYYLMPTETGTDLVKKLGKNYGREAGARISTDPRELKTCGVDAIGVLHPSTRGGSYKITKTDSEDMKHIWDLKGVEDSIDYAVLSFGYLYRFHKSCLLNPLDSV